MAGQLATIAVVPRERFSLTKRSLESLLAQRDPATELIYVDGGSPPLVRQYLEQQAVRNDFTLISTERFVAPNVARNLALERARTRYVAFVDNDVLFAPAWLERLVDCAESTGAWIVGPLVCQGEGRSRRVRSAGGKATIATIADRRALRQQLAHRGQPLGGIAPALVREPVGQVELHATLIRTDALTRLGAFDEQLPSAEHLDLCLAAHRHGGAIYLEPGAMVTYLPPPPFESYDLPYFQLRWSDAWNRATIARLAARWDLPADDAGLTALAASLDDHRRLTLESYRRLLRLFGHKSARWIERVLIAPLEQAANRRRFPDAPSAADDTLRRAA